MSDIARLVASLPKGADGQVVIGGSRWHPRLVAYKYIQNAYWRAERKGVGFTDIVDADAQDDIAMRSFYAEVRKQYTEGFIQQDEKWK